MIRNLFLLILLAAAGSAQAKIQFADFKLMPIHDFLATLGEEEIAGKKNSVIYDTRKTGLASFVTVVGKVKPMGADLAGCFKNMAASATDLKYRGFYKNEVTIKEAGKELRVLIQDPLIQDWNSEVKVGSDVLILGRYNGSCHAGAGALPIFLMVEFNTAGKKGYYTTVGMQAVEAGKYDLAMSAYNDALLLDPNNIDLTYNRARVHMFRNDLDAAITDISVVIKANPKDAEAIGMRGYFKQRQGKKMDALEDYNQSIAVDPKMWLSYLNRGYLLREIGRLPEAARDIALVIKNNPQMPSAFCEMALIKNAQGNKVEAKSFAQNCTAETYLTNKEIVALKTK